MQRKKILTAVLGAAFVAGVPVAFAQTGEGQPPPVTPNPIPIVVLCDGQAPTIPGATAGADVLEGTSGVDVIQGLGGNDTIRGKGGNDIICGGPGRDLITGGKDDDTVFGDEGRDLLLGTQGEDTLGGGDGNDRLHGGGDRDDVRGGPDNDIVAGGGADERIIQGGTGDDIVRGNRGNDKNMQGNDGEDHMDGGPGNDIVSGSVDNDVLRGGDGEDRVNGQPGDERVDGGRGPDISLTGGDGIDVHRPGRLGGCRRDAHARQRWSPADPQGRRPVAGDSEGCGPQLGDRDDDIKLADIGNGARDALLGDVEVRERNDLVIVPGCNSTDVTTCPNLRAAVEHPWR